MSISCRHYLRKSDFGIIVYNSIGHETRRQISLKNGCGFDTVSVPYCKSVIGAVFRLGFLTVQTERIFVLFLVLESVCIFVMITKVRKCGIFELRIHLTNSHLWYVQYWRRYAIFYIEILIYQTENITLLNSIAISGRLVMRINRLFCFKNE